MRRLNAGVAIALSIGTGAALAASMGAVGYAIGIGLFLGIYGIGRWRSSIG